MFRKIVVGHDGTPAADDAVALARQLRDPDGGRLIVTTVVPWSPPVILTAPGGDELARETFDRVHARLERTAERLGLADVPHRLEPVADASPARGLHRLAEEEEADLVVLGATHRHRLGRLTGRATVQRLMHGAPCAVAVAAPDQAERFSGAARICVAYDASPEARAALSAAYALAAGRHATVDIARVAETIVGPYGVTPALMASEMVDFDLDQARHEVDEAVAQAPPDVAVEGHVLEGPVAAALLSRAVGADLLVAGSRSYGPVHRVLAGSTSIALLTDGEVPVLVLPRAEDVARPADEPVAAAATR